MTAQSKATIKTYFETGDKPTQAQFVNFIDSSLFLSETATQTVSGNVNFVGGLQVSGATLGTAAKENLSTVIVDDGAGALTIASSAVTNAMLANMVQATIKGRADAAGTGVPVDLTATQVMAILQGTTRYKVGSFTRDVTTATGTQAVTGVGFAPKAILILASINSTFQMSVGLTDGLSNLCLRDISGLSAGTYGPAGNLINLLVDGSNFTTGNLSSLDADGFTISWTKTGLPTGTATLYYLALR